MPDRGTILVVDDDEAIRETLRDCLSEEGYEVVCAANGEQALEAIDRWQPKMVLLDLMMPVMSGWEVLEVMQESRRLSDIPVVVVSAMAAPGVCGHVAKPIDLDLLLRLVHEHAHTKANGAAHAHR